MFYWISPHQGFSCIVVYFLTQEIEVDGRTNFAIVTQRAAAPTVLQIVLNHAERELDNTDWVVTRVRADTTAEIADSTGKCVHISLISGK